MALKPGPQILSSSSGPGNLCMDGKIEGFNGELKSLCSGGYGLKGIKVTLRMATDLGQNSHARLLLERNQIKGACFCLGLKDP